MSHDKRLSADWPLHASPYRPAWPGLIPKTKLRRMLKSLARQVERSIRKVKAIKHRPASHGTKARIVPNRKDG